MGVTNLLLADFTFFSGGSEVKELMERIYCNYQKKLGQKVSFRERLERKRLDVVEEGNFRQGSRAEVSG